MAGRISLVEEYENKDMIVQVKKCLDQTEAAVEASETARDVSIASAAEAHEASTNANSASAQAQTAAQTVSTYESRLGAVENESAGNRSSIQTIDGEITDIYNDLTNVVRKVGDTEQIVYSGLDLRGTNRTPNTPVGQLNNLIVNAKRLIEEIENKLSSYELMVRTVNNQAIYGTKMFHDWPQIISDSWAQLGIVSMDVDKSVVPAATVRMGGINFLDKKKNSIGMLAVELTDDGRVVMYFDGVKRNGDYFRTPNIVDVQL